MSAAVLSRLAKFAAQNPDKASVAYRVAAAAARKAVKTAKTPEQGKAASVLAEKLEKFAASAQTVFGGRGAIRRKTHAENFQEIMPYQDLGDGEEAASGPVGGVQQLEYTDFDKIAADVTATAHATQQAGGDDFNAWQAFHAGQQAEKYNKSPPVRIIPASAKDGETMFGNLVTVQNGTNALVPAPSSTGFGGKSLTAPILPEVQVCRWDGENDETLPVTITVGRVENSGGILFPYPGQLPGTIANYRPYGRLRYGVRGYAQDTITMDIGRGFQFCIAASFVYFSVGMDVPLNGTNGGAMQLGASLGWFESRTSAPIMRTVYIDALAVLGITTITIPVFAQTLLPPMSSDQSANASISLNFQTVDGTSVGYLKFAPGTVVAPIPLPNDAYQIQVTNLAGALSNIRLPFQLAL